MSQGALAAVLAGVALVMWPRPESRLGAALPLPTSVGHRRPRPRGGRQARRARARAVAEALLVLDGIGPALRVGLAPRTALEHLASTNQGPDGLPARLAAAAALPPAPGQEGASGSPVGGIWSRAAHESGAEELRLVAAAWSLADTCGVALADAVDLAAALLRDSRARQSRLDVLLAGPRATMSLLTALPLAGPVVGWLFGIDPVTLYAGAPAATASAVAGVALLVLGRLWCQALVRRALSTGRAAIRPSPGGDRSGGFAQLG